MLTVGVDAHKRITMAVALDAGGRAAARRRGPNSVEGWQHLAARAAGCGADLRWGLEGAWNDGRGLAQFPVESGATVYEVNARWTAAGRRRARTPGKADGLDARAVALVVWREAGTGRDSVACAPACALGADRPCPRDEAADRAALARGVQHARPQPAEG